MLRGNPFLRAGGDPRTLDEQQFAPDELHVDGGHVYVACPDGCGRTKVTNGGFEGKLVALARDRA
jgi:hypothetical protein